MSPLDARDFIQGGLIFRNSWSEPNTIEITAMPSDPAERRRALDQLKRTTMFRRAVWVGPGGMDPGDAEVDALRGDVLALELEVLDLLRGEERARLRRNIDLVGNYHVSVSIEPVNLYALLDALDQADDFRGLVDDVLTVWGEYAEGQFRTATGTERRIVADRSQTFLDLKLALEHPKTIVWPDGHPRKAARPVKESP